MVCGAEKLVKSNGSGFENWYSCAVAKTETTVEIDRKPWRVVLTWSGGRRPAVIAVEVKSLRSADGTRGEVSAAVLRELPIGRLIAANRPQPEEPSVEPEPRLGRRRAHDLEHYRAVAETYRAAVEVGEPPVVAVAEHFDTSPETARRWVHVARNRHGLLPAVRRGQTG